MERWLIGSVVLGIGGCSDLPAPEERSGGGGSGAIIETGDDSSSSGGACDVSYDVDLSIGLRMCETSACSSTVVWPYAQLITDVHCVVDRSCDIDGTAGWCLRDCEGSAVEPDDVLFFSWSIEDTLPLPLEDQQEIVITRTNVLYDSLWVVRDAVGNLLGLGGETPRPPPPEATAPLSLLPGEAWCSYLSHGRNPAHAVVLDASVGAQSIQLDWGQTNDVAGYRVFNGYAIDIPYESFGKWGEGGNFGFAAVRL